MQEKGTSQGAGAARTNSRRRDIRLEPPEGVRVSVEGVSALRGIKDISYRGMCVVGEAPLPLRSIQRATLALGPTRVDCRVRVIHCHPELNGWLIGMEFLEPTTPGQNTIDDLLNTAMAMSISFS